MDGESRIMLYAGITAFAALIGTFVLWGPPTAYRPKRRGDVIGLQNLGLTCYLNSLLQAMASCYYFVNWLNLQRPLQGEVTTAMRRLINILCGKTTPLPEEGYFVSPVDVVNALHHSGWKITNSQQDVHELLCNLITILEEEAFKSCLDLSVSVHVITENIKKKHETLGNQYSKRILFDSDSGQNISFDCMSINGSICERVGDFKNDSDNITSLNTPISQLNFISLKPVRLLNNTDIIEGKGDGPTNYQNGFDSASTDVLKQKFENRIHTKMKSPREHIAHDLSQSPRPSPFRGYLTNKIECTKCSYKSVLRYDKFDSISLHLPEPSNQPIHTLYQLLNNFVKNELIGGITCEGCNKNRAPNTDLTTSPAVKLSRFGKLPACLCIHIVRTSFYEYGVYKRQDYVDFPEYIVMDPYLHKVKKMDVPMSKNESDTSDTEDPDIDLSEIDAMRVAKHIYRLKAVIVHRGSHNDGHFITYRRGTFTSELQHRSSDSKWYLVSDAEVKETTLYNVLSSVAYVLFYEKSTELVQ